MMPFTNTCISPVDIFRVAATWTHCPVVTVVVESSVVIALDVAPLPTPNANLPPSTDEPKSLPFIPLSA